MITTNFGLDVRRWRPVLKPLVMTAAVLIVDASLAAWLVQSVISLRGIESELRQAYTLVDRAEQAERVKAAEVMMRAGKTTTGAVPIAALPFHAELEEAVRRTAVRYGPATAASMQIRFESAQSPADAVWKSYDVHIDGFLSVSDAVGMAQEFAVIPFCRIVGFRYSTGVTRAESTGQQDVFAAPLDVSHGAVSGFRENVRLVLRLYGRPSA